MVGSRLCELHLDARVEIDILTGKRRSGFEEWLQRVSILYLEFAPSVLFSNVIDCNETAQIGLAGACASPAHLKQMWLPQQLLKVPWDRLSKEGCQDAQKTINPCRHQATTVEAIAIGLEAITSRVEAIAFTVGWRPCQALLEFLQSAD